MPRRKSARTQNSRTVYSDDPVIVDDELNPDGDGVIAGAAEAPTRAAAPKRKPRKVKREDSSDEEYAPAISFAGGDEDQDAEIETGEEAVDFDSQDDDVVEVDEVPKRSKPSMPAKPLLLRDADGMMQMNPDETHSRGIMDPKNHVSKFMHYISTFGSDDRDLGPIVHARGRWRYNRDATFPSRMSLEQVTGESDLPLGPTYGMLAEEMEKERTRGWDWYYSQEAAGAFKQKQLTTKIKEGDARRIYLPDCESKKHTILMGPADAQSAFHLGYHESLDISEAWGDKKAKSSVPSDTKMREGWLLSIGHKINCMAWAPNQDFSSQYLAVASPITSEQKTKTGGKPEPVSTFRPSLPYPSALQLWEFKGRKAGEITDTLDMSFKPRLRLVICSDWGDLRRMAWCPAGRECRDSDNADDKKNIGLLATLWGDGKLRILDVKIQKNSQKTEYGEYESRPYLYKRLTHKIIVKMTSPSFEAIPPSTVCACVTWLSPSDIAVGCANGFVAIWSILPSSKSQNQPYFYHLLHSTYILNIISMYPTNPHLLSTVSMDGETRLWSMIDPQGDTSSTVRVRTPSAHITYSPVLQSVCAGDDNECGRIMPVRRFFGTNATAKIPSSISCLSPCSFWHPSLLSGGNGGEVLASNPLRRLLYSKEKQWQQIWFTHDWVPDKQGNGQGVSRFYDGFQAETQGNARERANEGRPAGFTITTIFDENQHVTALGWNPNRRCAAWGCAALGCGLIRVEDLAS